MGPVQCLRGTKIKRAINFMLGAKSGPEGQSLMPAYGTRNHENRVEFC
jgi:hypothetical protein